MESCNVNKLRCVTSRPSWAPQYPYAVCLPPRDRPKQSEGFCPSETIQLPQNSSISCEPERNVTCMQLNWNDILSSQPQGPVKTVPCCPNGRKAYYGTLPPLAPVELRVKLDNCNEGDCAVISVNPEPQCPVLPRVPQNDQCQTVLIQEGCLPEPQCPVSTSVPQNDQCPTVLIQEGEQCLVDKPASNDTVSCECELQLQKSCDTDCSTPAAPVVCVTIPKCNPSDIPAPCGTCNACKTKRPGKATFPVACRPVPSCSNICKKPPRRPFHEKSTQVSRCPWR